MAAESTENLLQHDYNDIDDDDDHLYSSHKIVPTILQPSSATEQNIEVNQLNSFDTDLQDLLKNDLKKYFNTVIPKDYFGFVQCHIKREKEGLTKGFLPTFSLYFDGQNENDQTFLLFARKHLTIGGHSEYFIGNNVQNPSDLNDENSIAKLKGINITDTDYILYDQQNSSNNQQQSAAIIYDEHIFGSKEPRKFRIFLPDNEKNVQPLKENETILDQSRSEHSNDLIQLTNQIPIYSEESKEYILKFSGNDIIIPSHKNFQIISSNEDQNNIVMQFGRIDEENYSLNYRYPLTIIQAFAIALSSFHRRFRT